MAKPEVDQAACVGCGTCEALCPECFEIRDDGKSWVICEDCDKCEEVADACPVQAITCKD